jgi:hypothetical protein
VRLGRIALADKETLLGLLGEDGEDVGPSI